MKIDRSITTSGELKLHGFVKSDAKNLKILLILVLYQSLIKNDLFMLIISNHDQSKVLG